MYIGEAGFFLATTIGALLQATTIGALLQATITPVENKMIEVWQIPTVFIHHHTYLCWSIQSKKEIFKNFCSTLVHYIFWCLTLSMPQASTGVRGIDHTFQSYRWLSVFGTKYVQTVVKAMIKVWSLGG